MNSASQSANALPLYVQISELLIRDIAAGRLIDGERLPPERDMANDLGISVGTLRKALAELTDKGLLERVQGSGNYIRQAGETNSVYAMFRLELHSGGGLPRADILSVDRLEKPADLKHFGLAETGTRIRRLRYLNDAVIAVEEIWLDASAGLLTLEQISDSLYHTYQKQLGFWITRAEDRVGIGAVPDWAPDRFPKEPGAVTGYIERLSWSNGPVPIEFSKTWFDPDKALYVQRLK
ncbi:GntR family transcriptional regulator [Roseibium hamelinense]|uniref:GntR family transcriptional regulator n=1 Tax=Roseibium hamelinense TaxID=150831 RepID=A0A562TH53_9HYPH|nr:GntR family transcriptional regulator [Roseibium hamelinense]MTI43099.1 GntR family transcriptional regulator [Roseibium hamelinense]TWI92554.1 GntR family transcriptional regulator [Roseibium hamelinense]